MRRNVETIFWAVIGLGVLVVGGIAVYGIWRDWTPPAPPPLAGERPPYTISGSLVLIATALERSQDSCAGMGGFSDVEAGKQVTVFDQGGRVIGTGTFGPGIPEREFTCRFRFTVAGLPEVEFYQIEIQRRGTLRYGLAEMKARGWTVEFILSQSR